MGIIWKLHPMVQCKDFAFSDMRSVLPAVQLLVRSQSDKMGDQSAVIKFAYVDHKIVIKDVKKKHTAKCNLWDNFQVPSASLKKPFFNRWVKSVLCSLADIPLLHLALSQVWVERVFFDFSKM